MRILLVVYDNESHLCFFPSNIAYIASALLNAGHDVEIYSQDIHHYPDEHLTDYLNHNKFDMVGIGIIAGYYQYKKLLRLAKAINTAKNKPFFVIGGHGPTPDPAYFMRITGADAVVMGEGEETIVELCERVENIQTLSEVAGLAFWDGDEVKINYRRQTIQDLDSIPFPAYDLFPIDIYRLFRKPHIQSTDFLMPVIAARGCQFACNFCYRMDKGYRTRSNESILDEILLLQKNYDINYIVFADELFMGSEEQAISRSEAFIRSGIRFNWSCDGRLNYASKEVLKTMSRAGCKFINYGIESVNDEVLKNMKKALTVEQIHRGVQNTLEAGISPGLNLIWGNIGDTRETLMDAVHFLLQYDDGSQMRTIRPVTPYPGCPLYYKAIQEKKLLDIDDFYRNKHVNSDLLAVNFTDIPDDQFHHYLCIANTALLENYYRNKKRLAIEQTEDLYYKKNAEFRGYRHT